VRVRGRVALERARDQDFVVSALERARDQDFVVSYCIIFIYLVLVHGYVHLSFEHAELLRHIYEFRLSH
jgi:hypothetical protein